MFGINTLAYVVAASSKKKFYENEDATVPGMDDCRCFFGS
jgi:hypothetical protein